MSGQEGNGPMTTEIAPEAQAAIGAAEAHLRTLEDGVASALSARDQAHEAHVQAMLGGTATEGYDQAEDRAERHLKAATEARDRQRAAIDHTRVQAEAEAHVRAVAAADADLVTIRGRADAVLGRARAAAESFGRALDELSELADQERLLAERRARLDAQPGSGSWAIAGAAAAWQKIPRLPKDAPNPDAMRQLIARLSMDGKLIASAGVPDLSRGTPANVQAAVQHILEETRS